MVSRTSSIWYVGPSINDVPLKSLDFNPPSPLLRHFLTVSPPSNRTSVIATNTPHPPCGKDFLLLKVQFSRKCYLIHTIYMYIQQTVLASKFPGKCLLLTASFLSRRNNMSMGHTQKKRFIDKEFIKSHTLPLSRILKHLEFT